MATEHLPLVPRCLVSGSAPPPLKVGVNTVQRAGSPSEMLQSTPPPLVLPTARGSERTTLRARDGILVPPPHAAALTDLLLRHAGRKILGRLVR